MKGLWFQGAWLGPKFGRMGCLCIFGNGLWGFTTRGGAEVAPVPFPVGPLLARWREGRAVGRVGAWGVWDFLPLLEPLFLLDPTSSFLRPRGPQGTGGGEPQSHTSRHVRHCLGKVCFGIAGNKSCWDRSGSVSLPCPGKGPGRGECGPLGPARTPRTLKRLGIHGWRRGGVSVEMRPSGSVQSGRNRERWEEAGDAGFEDGSLEPLAHHPPSPPPHKKVKIRVSERESRPK